MSRRRAGTQGPVWIKVQVEEHLHQALTIRAINERRRISDLLRHILEQAMAQPAKTNPQT